MNNVLNALSVLLKRAVEWDVIERLAGERARLRFGGDAALSALPQARATICNSIVIVLMKLVTRSVAASTSRRAISAGSWAT